MEASSQSASEAAPGLTMEQHAGVAVALAEGFVRAEVLAQEQVDEATYRAADLAWKRRLVADARGEGKLFAAYQARRAEAEDWLQRKVSPLGDDVGAWLGFLKAWSAAAEPYALLAGAGLTLADVGRLGRAWDAAFARDEKLAKRAAKLASTGEARMPARVTVEPAKLKPFQWSPKARLPTKQDPLVSTDPELPDRPEEAADVVVVPVTPSYLRGGAEESVGPAVGPAPAIPGRMGPPAGVALPSYARAVAPDMTAPVFYLRGGDGLPFTETGPGAEAGSPEPAIAMPVAKVPVKAIGETVMAVDLPSGPALPFGPGASRTAPEKAPKSPPEIGTVAVFELPKGPALPFAPGAPAVTPAARPAGQGSVPANSPATPPAFQSGETVFSDGPIRGAPAVATPFETPANKAPEKPTPRPPTVSLVEHATLSAELGLRPAKSAETLARCGLDGTSKTALDRHFNEQRAADPAADAAWNKAYQAAYTRLLLSSWKGPGAK